MAIGETYDMFVAKFEVKKTTDDCYTPENIYNAVRDWVCNKYNVDKNKIVRPFYPGGDYQNFDYPADCVVVDNPPFSIYAQILRWYEAHNVRFFLFAPALTLISPFLKTRKTTFIATGVSVIYENGANVNTSFATNLDDPSVALKSEPKLFKILDLENEENKKKRRKLIRKLKHPEAVFTAAKCNWMSSHGIDFSVKREDCCSIKKLDNEPKTVFGGALLLSERATKERMGKELMGKELMGKELMEKELMEKIELSEREKEIQKMLGR